MTAAGRTSGPTALRGTPEPTGAGPPGNDGTARTPSDLPPAPGAGTAESSPPRIGPFAVAFGALLLFWIALSGKFDALHLLPGVAAAAGAALLTLRLLALPPAAAPEREIAGLPRSLPRLLGYGLWLAGQVLGSAVRVARLVLDPRLPVAPEVVRIEDGLPHPLSRLVLAHSITLTPGTVTIDADEKSLTIHALDADAAAAVAPDGGAAAGRLRRLLSLEG